MVRLCLTELLAAAERAVASDSDPSVQLATLTCAHVAMSATNPLTCRVTDQEVRLLTGSNLADVVALRDRYERLWDKVLARGARQGVFDLADRKLTRLALLDMCNGIANWYVPTGRATVSALQARYVQLVCRAVGMAATQVVESIAVTRLDCEPLPERAGRAVSA